MAYTKKTWATGDIAEAVDMNHIEDGIYDNDQAITAMGGAVGDQGEAITALQGDVFALGTVVGKLPEPAENDGTFVITQHNDNMELVDMDTALGDSEVIQNKAGVSMVALIETGTTASRAYTAGQYFLKDNQFCKALTSIASGETLTLGTNYAVTTIGEELFGSSGGSSIITTTATLTVNGWSNNTQTVSVTGVTATNTIIATYDTGSRREYLDSDIYCSAQGAGTLTFTCGSVPSSAVTVNIMIIEE